jgi:hypothetical protein
MIDVIYAYDQHGYKCYWHVDGSAMCVDEFDIVEVVRDD